MFDNEIKKKLVEYLDTFKAGVLIQSNTNEVVNIIKLKDQNIIAVNIRDIGFIKFDASGFMKAMQEMDIR
jgi:indole-3-glycerol phosphate synthase